MGTYTLTVSNASGAGPTNGTAVAVTESLPNGLTMTLVPPNVSGSGWTCTVNTVTQATCTNASAVNGGSSFPPITVTVNVASNAPASVTNSVGASGGGSAPASGTDVTSITAFAITPVTPVTLPGGQVGNSYSGTLSATGGSGGYTWSLATGALPSGITLYTSGALRGTPTLPGYFPFKAKVTDSAGNTLTTPALDIGVLSISPATLLSAMQGVPYSQVFSVSGGSPGSDTVWFPFSGSLPLGLTWSVESMTLSGTPKAYGTSTFTVQVEDQNGDYATQTYSLTVQPLPTTTVAASLGGNPLVGVTLTVDNAPCTAPCGFQWAPGSAHTIAFASQPVPGSTGGQYVFSSWSDGGLVSHPIVIATPPAAATYTAALAMQYQLTVNPGIGGTLVAPMPASGPYIPGQPVQIWCNTGQSVQMSVTPKPSYAFTGWSGAGPGAVPSTAPQSTTVTIGSGPVTETANFTPTIGYSPTLTGINIGQLPVDRYDQCNNWNNVCVQDDASAASAALESDTTNLAIIGNCRKGHTIRACMQGFIANWAAQGVSGIRFTLGFSVPMDYAPPPTYSFMTVAQLPPAPCPPNAPTVLTTPLVSDNGFSHPWCSSAGVMRPANASSLYPAVGQPGRPGYHPGCADGLRGESSAAPSGWADELSLFFQDVARYGNGMAISPALGAVESNGRLTNTPSPPSTVSLTTVNNTCKANLLAPESNAYTDMSGANYLSFLPWAPYGYLGTDFGFNPAGMVEDGADYNDAYTAAMANPVFWGWGPFNSLVSTVVSLARNSSLPIREFEIYQEIDLFNTTVVARYITDNQQQDASGNTFPVLAVVRAYLAGFGYDPLVATYSAYTGNLMQAQADCTSVYEDPGTILWTSELAGALAGPGGAIGIPFNYSYVGALACGGMTGIPYINPTTLEIQLIPWMASLPFSYTPPPTNIDFHAYPCYIASTSPYPCATDGSGNLIDSTGMTTTVYNDIYSYISNRNLAGSTVVFGESSVVGWNSSACDIGTLPPSDVGATWVVNGYKESNLYANYKTATVFQPFNNLQQFNPSGTVACYNNPLAVAPYSSLIP